jgi:isoquinoline 1-oxidoreductase beta subunit
VASQLLVEQRFEVPTGSWRSIYSGFTMAANEMFVDELAKAQRIDPVAFRKRYLSSDAAKRCLTHVANAGSWGRSMPPGQAQGVAIHVEYRSAVAYLVEIDPTGTTSDPRLRVRRRRRPDQSEGPRGAAPGSLDRRLLGDVPRGQPSR